MSEKRPHAEPDYSRVRYRISTWAYANIEPLGSTSPQLHPLLTALQIDHLPIVSITRTVTNSKPKLVTVLIMTSRSSSRPPVSGHLVQEEYSETTRKGADSLCERCRGIDFSSLFDSTSLRARTWEKRTHRHRHCGLIDLGVLREDTTCILCRFFYSARWPQAPMAPFDHYHLRLFTTIEISKFSFPNTGSLSGATVCSVVPGKLSEYNYNTVNDGVKAYYACEPTLRANGYFVPDESAPTIPVNDSYRGPFSLTKGRRVLPRHVDFDLIRGWLQKCDHDHIESRLSRNTTYSAPLRCIDCCSREVVKLPPGAEYAALSYVWGGISAAGMLKREQGTGRLFVSENVSQVIEDSIVVVKSIGSRYLWVDQCCIDQNDIADKMAQIQNMDNIYQGAYLTIVAAAGKDSTYGLPGVTWRPRREQLYVNTGSFALVGSLPTAHEVARNSTWATRGWTYQEAVLPRRLLIFTDYQAHLVCPAQIWCEDKAFSRGSTKTVSHESLPVLSQIFEFNRYRRGNPDLRDAFRHFEQFSKRALTCEGDALDAIRGLLSRCPFYTYYGMLLQRYESPETTSQSSHGATLPVQFFQSLWFSFGPPDNNFEVRRRPGFPSWSWLGWKAQDGIDYNRNINPSVKNTADEPYRLQRKASFWAEDHNGTLIQLADLLPSPNPSVSSSDSTRIIPELSAYLWVENTVLQLQFQYIRDKHPVYSEKEGYLGIKFEKENVKGSVDLVHRPRTQDDPLYQRLVTETWDCLLLCCTSYYMQFLVLEWSDTIDTTAYRVGTLTLYASSDRYQALLERVPHSVRKIRLG